MFVDLGMSPLCESFLSFEQLDHMEPFFPLQVYICENCFLVQVMEFVSPEEIFSDYAYFSSYSETWVQHCKRYTEMIIDRLNLGRDSLVVEIASNDGYLLQHFIPRKIPVLGIEPALNIAQIARQRGIPTLITFFSEAVARSLKAEGKQADLLIGNNVLAQVTNLNDFIRGMKILLKPEGVITMEFPHLLRLMEENQFDTIYHEHFSYFSFFTVEKIFAAHGLVLFDVEELPTHGGSLRIFAYHKESSSHTVTPAVFELRAREEALGFMDLTNYSAFGEQVKRTKRKLLHFLIRAKDEGKSIAGYGAPGKASTLLNYCGIGTDFLDYTVDISPYKQGKFMPGTHIPIFPPEKIQETKPDYVLILPWNIRGEIMEQLSFIRSWGGQFVVPIPEVKIYSS